MRQRGGVLKVRTMADALNGYVCDFTGMWCERVGTGEIILTLAESIKGHPYLILSTSLHSKVFKDGTHACGTIIAKSILLRSVMKL